MRTITHEGQRYVIADSSDGPVLVPTAELIKVGNRVKYNARTYHLITIFEDEERAEAGPMAVIAVVLPSKRPYSVVPVSALSPA